VNHEVQPAEPDVSDKPKRRWYQFTLRTVGVWMVLLCLLLGSFSWWRDRTKRQRRILAALKEFGATVDNEKFHLFEPASGRLADLDNKFLLSARVRYVLGDDFTSEIVSVGYSESKSSPLKKSSQVVGQVKWLSRLRTFHLEGEVSPRDLREFPFIGTLENLGILLPQEIERGQLTDDDLAVFKKAKKLEVLFLSRQRIEGGGLVHLQKCPLRMLFLSGTGLEDQGLAHLSMNDKLKFLSLANTRITDRGIAEAQLPQSLECIVLTNTRIGDRALERLQQLPNLAELHIGQTGITQDGLNRFYAAKPKCTVVWDDIDFLPPHLATPQ